MTLIEITGFALVTIGALGLGWVIRLLWGAFSRAFDRAAEAEATLRAIANATRNGKSGTAKMVHRMAMEGLNNAN